MDTELKGETMELQVIPKKETIPAFDNQTIKIQHIEYDDASYHDYEGEEITEEVVAELLKRIPVELNGKNHGVMITLSGYADLQMPKVGKYILEQKMTGQL